jgi:integrase
MPRKPVKKKTVITVIVANKPISVTLHPPAGKRRSWYVYWAGIGSKKSTGTPDLDEAIVVAENMLSNGAKRPTRASTVLSDEEFEELQRVHYSRRTDPVTKKRAEQSLKSCLNAIAAFRDITGISPIASATADDCAAFQRKALKLPKNWRQNYPKGKKDVQLLSPNTVQKWSRSLQAAFERANINGGKRCVRGVVDAGKLLSVNPWVQFDWVEGADPTPQRFNDAELLGILEFLGGKWSKVSVGPLVAKMLLWSAARRSEITGLKWTSLRALGPEHHFDIVGKWGVERWFRIPDALLHELEMVRRNDDFVFAAFNDQLREHHRGQPRSWVADRVGAEFDPESLGDWFYNRLQEWPSTTSNARATIHMFRKTMLQHARNGEDLNLRVAQDAKVGVSVMMTHYVEEMDEQMRQRSNRTFQRIVASLSPEVRRRYGYVPSPTAELEGLLQAAYAARDWQKVAELAAKLEQQRSAEGPDL